MSLYRVYLIVRFFVWTPFSVVFMEGIVPKSTLAKDSLPTGNYLSEGESKCGWANTPRTDVNRIEGLQDAMSISMQGLSPSQA